MLAMIVAVDGNNGIGYNNDLLFKFKEDMQLFKSLTTGEVVVMGKNTWISLPERSRPLPKRINYIISDEDIDVSECENTYVIRDIKEVANLANRYPNNTVFIMGGASIYRQLMPYADKLYVTHINLEAGQVDTYFPEIKKCEWKEVNATPITDFAIAVEYNRIGDEAALS